MIDTTPSHGEPEERDPDADAGEPDVEGHMLNMPLLGVKLVEPIKPQTPKTKDIDFGSTNSPNNPHPD